MLLIEYLLPGISQYQEKFANSGVNTKLTKKAPAIR